MEPGRYCIIPSMYMRTVRKTIHECCVHDRVIILTLRVPNRRIKTLAKRMLAHFGFPSIPINNHFDWKAEKKLLKKKKEMRTLVLDQEATIH